MHGRIAIWLLVLSVHAVAARGVTQIQGFYEAFAQLNGEDTTWQLGMPNHYVELRALSTPWQNVDAFVEVSARSNRFRTESPGFNTVGNFTPEGASVHRPELLFNEGHVSLRRQNAEVVFFSSQNRFWFSQPLLQTVDGNTLQDDRDGPRAQAVRVDFWDVRGFGGLAYYGDKATNAEDFFAARVFKSLRANRIRFGSTLGRKDFGTDTSDYDMTLAFDAELALGELFDSVGRFGRTTFVAEVARNYSGFLDEDDDMRNGAQIELRDVRLDAVSFKGQAWYREPRLYTGMSGREGDDDRRGYWVETWYRLPRKQVNLRWSHWRQRSFQETRNSDERFDENQHELELYGELKGGFSSWLKLRRFAGNDNPVAGTNVFRNVIFEVQGQNKLISVRPQIRFRDFGTRFATEGYGMDINLNVTSRWKFFGRFLNTNENTEARRTLFVQARYDAWSNSEFYIEYGDGGRSDRLTENDGFVSEGPSAQDQDTDRRFQLIMKMWF